MTEISQVAKEIERKYLLSKLPKELKALSSTHFKTDHGWLPGEIIQERITFSGKSDKFFRVIKTGKGLERIEAQEEISIDLFTALWPLTKDRRVSKTRYLVHVGDGLIWEIDDFLDRDLQMAEIEIPTADYKVTLPRWLKNCVVREVTEEPAFLNINLGLSTKVPV